MPDAAQGLISIDVSVTDDAGKSVSGLSERGFTLLDNSLRQKIVTFRAVDGAIVQPAGSLETVLVIDELNTLPDPQQGQHLISGVYHSIENFLHANGGVLLKPTMIYRVTEEGLFAMPHATMDGNELLRELQNPAQQPRIWSPSMIAGDIRTSVKSRGASHDAVVKAELAARVTNESLVALGSIALEERRKPGRKLLFWLGNGWPVESGNAAGLSDFSIELLTRMREARINLWSALEAYDVSGIATPATKIDEALATDMQRESPTLVEKELSRDVNKNLVEAPKPDASDLRFLSLPIIAMRSGGGILDPSHDLAARIGERIAEEGTYYSLTFDPQRTSMVDEYHHLQITFDKPRLTAHAFEDYYDQPVFYDQAPDNQSVSVKQLQRLITSAHGISDAKLARQLENIRLTERLSSANLATLEKSLRGNKTREALEILADRSAFFAAPEDETITAPPPEFVAQQHLISQVVSYINSIIPRLPDFLATRTSVQYYERPANEDQTWKTARADQSLHEAEISKASIRFSKGQELVKDERVKKERDMQTRPQNGSLSVLLSPYPQVTKNSGRSSSNEDQTQGRQHLKTVGAFGPILGTIMFVLTSPHSQLDWDHWEQADGGRLAVFRYHVTQGTPLFSAGFCCLPVDNKSVPFIENVPFHGIIAVDPETGTIIRLTVQSDLGWRLPLERSDLMIEYARTQAESRVFICPSKSVSISRQRSIMTIHEWGEDFKVFGPFETVLNEMRFDNYHMFGSTSRILPDYVDVPQNR